MGPLGHQIHTLISLPSSPRSSCETTRFVVGNRFDMFPLDFSPYHPPPFRDTTSVGFSFKTGPSVFFTFIVASPLTSDITPPFWDREWHFRQIPAQVPSIYFSCTVKFFMVSLSLPFLPNRGPSLLSCPPSSCYSF